MTHTAEAPRSTRRVGFWLLVGILAVSGVAMALIAVFGWFDSSAFSLTWRVFLADVYLICSFAAQHAWLRRAAWVGTGIAFLAGMLNVFSEYTPFNKHWSHGNYMYTYGDRSTGWSPWMGFDEDLELAINWILIGLIVLGFVSLAYRWIVSERVLSVIYVTTFVTGIAAVLIGALMTVGFQRFLHSDEGWQQAFLALLILALTGSAIVTIGAFVQRRAVKAAEAADAAPLFGAGIAEGAAPGVIAGGVDRDELRTVVRELVDEYLAERE